MVALTGELSFQEDRDPSVIVQDIRPAASLYAGGKTVNIQVASPEDPRIPALLRILGQHPGPDEARFFFAGRRKLAKPKGISGVLIDDALLRKLRQAAGEGNVRVTNEK